MKRVYTVVFEAVSVTAAQDFFELTPADDKPVDILAVVLTQVGNADIGDTAEELLRWSIIRGHATGGSGGSAPTPRPVDRSGPAAGFAAEVNNTTIASTGTTHILHADAFNVRAPFIWIPPPGMECEASQADTTMVVRLNTAPADAITLSGTLYVAEAG